MFYRPNIICTTGGRMVHLKFIESFGLLTIPNEDATVDKLRGDTILNIRTISGAEYSVSIDGVLKWLREDASIAHDDIISAIYERWARFQHKD